ncbi:MAG TPA: cell division protein FtsL [Pseudobacteroides sp.]|nr:cell division protein FtsL [Pseudobacteroides sp.]
MLAEKEKYYYGTAAPKIDYDVYENNKVLKAKKRQKRNNKVKLKAVFCILIFFLSFSHIIYMYAQVTEMDYLLNKDNKVLNEHKNENIRLKLEIQKNLDLNRIREIAQTKLDMQKPDKHQIIYVNVPKTDFTEIPEKKEGISKGSLISYVEGIFSSLD